MVAIFLMALFAESSSAFTLLISVIVVLGAWEWSALSELKSRFHRIVYVAGFALVLFAASVLQLESQLAQYSDWLAWVFLFSCVFWLCVLYIIIQYPSGQLIWSSRAVRLFLGVMVLLVAWLALVFMRSHDGGQYWIVFTVTIVAAADIGAYFAGKALGKTKLAPAVSPGKSWEGLVGGVLMALIVAAVFHSFYLAQFPQNDGPSVFLFLATAVVLAAVSVLGDLFESMLKRRSGVKDSGNILPGHGGILDRIDGLLAAIPVFALIVICLNG